MTRKRRKSQKRRLENVMEDADNEDENTKERRKSGWEVKIQKSCGNHSREEKRKEKKLRPLHNNYLDTT